jgi:hypothetical protein
MTLPSSSKNTDGSIPGCATGIGSDHGPAAAEAVTMKLPPDDMLVVVM